MESNTAYKWRKIFAAKAYGCKEIKLTPAEAQELIDDIEQQVKPSVALDEVSKEYSTLKQAEIVDKFYDYLDKNNKAYFKNKKKVTINGFIKSIVTPESKQP